jgi:hypothetical protein
MERNIIHWIILLISGIQLPLNAQFYDAVLLNQHTEINVTGGKLTRTISYDVLINNRVGEKYTEVEIPYSKLLKVSRIEAQITDILGKSIKKLNPSDITTRSAISSISLYEDNMLKEFTLKHNVYPYILKYAYQEQTDQFLYIDYWSPVLERKIPTLKASLSLSVPFGYKINHNEWLVNSPVIDTSQTAIRYIWTTNYKVLGEAEVCSPDISAFLPCVKIVPNEFLFEKKGSFETWQMYGNWQYEINKNLSGLPESEITTIRALIKNTPDRNEKIKTLYHYLQDATRYINVSIKTGGMIPYPASYVAENKFGDCKALTNYFKAVLKLAEIDAYYVKVHAGDQILPLDKAFPSQQFNHIILCVPDSNDTVWLDCTSDGPYNYLGTFTQGREVLIVDKDNSRLLKTPSLKACDVEEKRHIAVGLISENLCSVNFETKLRGEQFEQLSQITREYRKENQKIIIRNNFIPNGFELLDFQLLPAHRDSAFIQFNYQTKSDKLFQNYGNELIVRTIPFELPKFKKPAERNYPVQIDYPILKTDTQVYIIPEGYLVGILPLNKVIQSDFGKYTIEIKKANNEIIILKSFLLNAGVYSLTNYPDFYSFIKNIVDSENNTLIVASKNVKN